MSSATKTPVAPRAARWRSELTEPRLFAAGAEVLSASNTADVLLIDDGIVQLTHSRPGRSPITLGLRFPGWFLGAESVIVGQPSPVKATALTDVAASRMPQVVFLRLLKTDRTLSWHVNQMHARELADQDRRIMMGRAQPLSRLKMFLMELVAANYASVMEKRVQLKLPLSFVQLSQLLAISPAHVSRLFSKLARERCLSLDGEVLTILKPRSLEPTPSLDTGWPVNAVINVRRTRAND